ncbi:MAG: hypothetical protein ACRDGM_01950, partial [bacterium]
LMSTVGMLGLSFLVLCVAGIGQSVAQAAELTFELRIENGRVPENMRLIRVHSTGAGTGNHAPEKAPLVYVAVYPH